MAVAFRIKTKKIMAIKQLCSDEVMANKINGR